MSVRLLTLSGSAYTVRATRRAVPPLLPALSPPLPILPALFSSSRPRAVRPQDKSESGGRAGSRTSESEWKEGGIASTGRLDRIDSVGWALRRGGGGGESREHQTTPEGSASEERNGVEQARHGQASLLDLGRERLQIALRFDPEPVCKLYSNPITLAIANFKRVADFETNLSVNLRLRLTRGWVAEDDAGIGRLLVAVGGKCPRARASGRVRVRARVQGRVESRRLGGPDGRGGREVDTYEAEAGPGLVYVPMGLSGERKEQGAWERRSKEPESRVDVAEQDERLMLEVEGCQLPPESNLQPSPARDGTRVSRHIETPPGHEYEKGRERGHHSTDDRPVLGFSMRTWMNGRA
ncbi:hypothetical protein FB451DRAFT_1468501 [Mycena latifolia]|nr:hypothetical protein FB451DRAFT_1468501 [Mycena latifolia]